MSKKNAPPQSLKLWQLKVVRQKLVTTVLPFCKVLGGVLADPYSGKNIDFVFGASLVDIDHVVALSNAWQTGAFQFTSEIRLQFANDPLNLLAVSASLNRQ